MYNNCISPFPRARVRLDARLLRRALLFRNIVSTVNMGCQLCLRTITLHARNAEYNPKRFAAVIMRIR